MVVVVENLGQMDCWQVVCMLVLSMVGVECLDLYVGCQVWWVVVGNW